MVGADRDLGGGSGARAAAAAGWRHFCVAAGFLTTLPVPAASAMATPTAATADNGYLVGAMPMFPVVGALLGAAAGAVLLATHAVGLPPLAAGLAAVAALVLLTGALHEDGLGDVADGWGGGRSRETKLSIMADSRVGTFAVVAIVLSVSLRAAALAGVSAGAGLAALVAAGALSRAGMPVLLRWLPPARPTGLGTTAGVPGLGPTGVTVVLAAAIAGAMLGPVVGLVAGAAAALAILAVGALARRQIGGHTGDVCGAAQQVAETAVLLTVAAWR